MLSAIDEMSAQQAHRTLDLHLLARNQMADARHDDTPSPYLFGKRLIHDAPPPFPCGRSRDAHDPAARAPVGRSEEHTSELQSLMRISYAVFCLKKKKKTQ